MKKRAIQFHREKISLSLILTIVIAFTFSLTIKTNGQFNGFILKNGSPLFPVGFYEIPESDEVMKEMADAGINFIRCRNREDLDRAAKVGMLGWVPVKMQLGDCSEVRELVKSVRDHPALAVWEGPDEIVHQFTAWSKLHTAMGIHKEPKEWWKQTSRAVSYSEKQAEKIMPKLREGIKLVRRLDPQKRQVWFNEASSSDLKYVRQYIDEVDITGCDTYPVGGGFLNVESSDIVRVGYTTERWKKIGRGKPVWMVLQGFSWSNFRKERPEAYPTFEESRLMAYLCIVHGAKGIFYWGTNESTPDLFRKSIYALTSELAVLQPFLTAPEEKCIKANVIPAGPRPEGNAVKLSARKAGREWLIILINEDDHPHMGVEITGLNDLNGKTMKLLYGTEESIVDRGEFTTRLMPHQVKVFASNRKWQVRQKEGHLHPNR